MPNEKMKVMLAFGTRPEAIKMCPLALELKSRPSFEVKIAVSGQHRDMLYGPMERFGVRADFDLELMQPGQNLTSLTSKALEAYSKLFEEHAPRLVLVHGDTATTFASALAAFYNGIPVGHVEAGLRTWDLSAPFPEEFNRRAVSVVSKVHFAPTEAARNNLLKENIDASSIHVTGNTVIDALKTTVSKSYSHELLDWAEGSRLVMLTAHRRENLGNRHEGIFEAIRSVVEEKPNVKLVYPVHLNPMVAGPAERILSGHSRIKLVEPLDVFDFHNFLSRSYLVLTDSGGIQEEAPSLGVPVLVLRDATERPEGIAAGTLKLAGTKKDQVRAAFLELLDNEGIYSAMSKASNPYGDGKASLRIADIIERTFLQ
ncbi:MAG: UDP-N-acetylglucosamine 2-epimerase (non-hydrolyzing) [Eubacteriaceae bacterium]|nr:UDP-N-acetylglucosamine 2-epimerase (non-hydrolyzing) [Eubacteriaceae bacterium]